jgi:hypothetical protein
MWFCWCSRYNPHLSTSSPRYPSAHSIFSSADYGWDTASLHPKLAPHRPVRQILLSEASSNFHLLWNGWSWAPRTYPLYQHLSDTGSGGCGTGEWWQTYSIIYSSPLIPWWIAGIRCTCVPSVHDNSHNLAWSCTPSRSASFSWHTHTYGYWFFLWRLWIPFCMLSVPWQSLHWNLWGQCLWLDEDSEVVAGEAWWLVWDLVWMAVNSDQSSLDCSSVLQLEILARQQLPTSCGIEFSSILNAFHQHISQILPYNCTFHPDRSNIRMDK